MQKLLTLAPLVDETRNLIKVYDTGRWAHIYVRLLHFNDSQNNNILTIHRNLCVANVAFLQWRSFPGNFSASFVTRIYQPDRSPAQWTQYIPPGREYHCCWNVPYANNWTGKPSEIILALLILCSYNYKLVMVFVTICRAVPYASSCKGSISSSNMESRSLSNQFRKPCPPFLKYSI